MNYHPGLAEAKLKTANWWARSSCLSTAGPTSLQHDHEVQAAESLYKSMVSSSIVVYGPWLILVHHFFGHTTV